MNSSAVQVTIIQSPETHSYNLPATHRLNGLRAKDGITSKTLRRSASRELVVAAAAALIHLRCRWEVGNVLLHCSTLLSTLLSTLPHTATHTASMDTGGAPCPLPQPGVTKPLRKPCFGKTPPAEVLRRLLPRIFDLCIAVKRLHLRGHDPQWPHPPMLQLMLM